jgi:hypothetical protein
MTAKEKIQYLRIALQLQNIAVNDEMVDRLIVTYEKVQKLKGKFSVDDACDIEYAMDKKYIKKKMKVKAEPTK